MALPRHLGWCISSSSRDTTYTWSIHIDTYSHQGSKRLTCKCVGLSPYGCPSLHATNRSYVCYNSLPTLDNGYMQCSSISSVSDELSEEMQGRHDHRSSSTDMAASQTRLTRSFGGCPVWLPWNICSSSWRQASLLGDADHQGWISSDMMKPAVLMLHSQG